MMKKISVGILAGGKSSRMGRNKALIEYSGQTFLGRLINEFIGLGQVLVSLPSEGVYQVPDGVVTVCDEHADIGPMEGIRRVLQTAETDYVFVCAVDMPNLKSDLAEYLARFISSDYDCYVIRDEKHFQPLCAIYSKSVLTALEELISEGKYRLMDLLNRVRTNYISLEHTDFSRRMLANYNTSHELMKLDGPVVFCVSGTKDSGKTWLIERLINEFIRDGFSVGVIKHDGHDFEMDRDGTDTRTFYGAGAAYTAIFNERKFAVNAALPTDEEELLARLPDTDIVICEGLKGSKRPKFIVARQETLEGGEDYLRAGGFRPPFIGAAVDSESLTDLFSKEDIPVFMLDDIHPIYEHIRDYFTKIQ